MDNEDIYNSHGESSTLWRDWRKIQNVEIDMMKDSTPNPP